MRRSIRDAILLVLTITFSMATKAQIAKQITLYSFTGGSDGYNPMAGVVFDSAGNLYGTTDLGGTVNDLCPIGCGTVYQVAPEGSGKWTFKTVHNFVSSPNDVAYPSARLTFDTKGNLYSTSSYGGSYLCYLGYDCGGVFRLSPTSDWQEGVVFDFSSRTGETPQGGLTWYNGSFYGTTQFGPESNGNVGAGVVFQLTPSGNGQWKYTILHTFQGGVDGYEPYADLVFDQQGHAFGSAPYGGIYQQGDIFELTPSAKGGWSFTVIYSSHGGSASTMIVDKEGNLYGTFGDGGSQICLGGCGSVFELQPTANGWKEITLYEFSDVADGYAPLAGLVFDKQGNLYGTTLLGGTGTCQFYQFPGCGTVFKLTPTKNGWQKTTLYNFTGGNDGEFPNEGTLALDSSGNLYGTTLGGYSYGSSGYGTVYEIQP